MTSFFNKNVKLQHKSHRIKQITPDLVSNEYQRNEYYASSLLNQKDPGCLRIAKQEKISIPWLPILPNFDPYTPLRRQPWTFCILKLGQNKKGQKTFQLHRFLDTFYSLQLRKSIKKCCSWKIFWPFLFCDGFIILCQVTLFGVSTDPPAFFLSI